MNDQSQLLNPPQIMNQSQMLSQSQMASQPQMLNPSQMLNQSQMVNQSQMMKNQSQMLVRNYGVWPQQPQNIPHSESMKFPNPLKPNYAQAPTGKLGRSNWKGKKIVDNRKDLRRKEKTVPGTGIVGGTGGGGYKPPTLRELQSQNRLKARRFYPKKKYNRFAPFAPRNTTSFIIRAKKSGGIASLVSPCPVTPAVLPTPIFSPSREVLVDMAKEEWGVDGYGSMKGLIRLRSPGHEAEGQEEEDEDEGESSESDVEEHVEVERRLDHDLSRFEMIYPNAGGEYNNVLENRVDDQDTHIAHLEEENLTLKERLFLMERELGDLRRRLLCLERQNQGTVDFHEEVVENASETESEGGRDVRVMEDNNEVLLEYVSANTRGRGSNKKENDDAASDNEKEENNNAASDDEAAEDVYMEEVVPEEVVAVQSGLKHERVSEDDNDANAEGKRVIEDLNKADVEGKIAAEASIKVDRPGNMQSEKSIGDGDLSKGPALINRIVSPFRLELED